MLLVLGSSLGIIYSLGSSKWQYCRGKRERELYFLLMSYRMRGGRKGSLTTPPPGCMIIQYSGREVGAPSVRLPTDQKRGLIRLLLLSYLAEIMTQS